MTFVKDKESIGPFGAQLSEQNQFQNEEDRLCLLDSVHYHLRLMKETTIILRKDFSDLSI